MKKTSWPASPTGQSRPPPEGSPAGVEWPGPSRRARGIAAVLAVVLAAVTFAVVSREWRRAAPPPPPRPTSVEAKLIASPLPPTRAAPR